MSIVHITNEDIEPKLNVWVKDVNLDGSVNNYQNGSLGNVLAQLKITSVNSNTGNIANVRIKWEKKGFITNNGDMKEYIEYSGNFQFDILDLSLTSYVFHLNVASEGVQDGVSGENIVYDGQVNPAFQINNATEKANLDFFLPSTPQVNGGELELYFHGTNTGLPVGTWDATFRVMLPKTV